MQNEDDIDAFDNSISNIDTKKSKSTTRTRKLTTSDSPTKSTRTKKTTSDSPTKTRVKKTTSDSRIKSARDKNTTSTKAKNITISTKKRSKASNTYDTIDKEDVEDIEDAEDIEDVEIIEDIEGVEDVEDVENIEDVENEEYIKNIEEQQYNIQHGNSIRGINKDYAMENMLNLRVSSLTSGNTYSDDIDQHQPIIDINNVNNISSANTYHINNTNNKIQRSLSSKLRRRNKSKIFIYQDKSHIVQYVNLTDNKFYLPISTDDSSIFVTDEDNNIVSFSYQKSKQSDGQVGIGVECKVVKGKKTYIGTILSLSSSDVTLSTGEEIILIHSYDEIVVVDVNRYPYLMLPLNNKHLMISYIINDLRWNCRGIATINSDNIMNLDLMANIINNTNGAIDGDVSLISNIKNINNVVTTRRVASALMVQQDAYNDSNALNNDENNITYQMGMQSLSQNTSQNISNMSIGIIKIYYYETRKKTNYTTYGYRFNTSIFIPSCTVNIYTTDADGIIQYVSNSTINEHQPHTDVDLIINDSSKVQASSVIDIQNIDKKTIETIDARIDNRNNETITFILKHFVGDRHIDMSTVPFQKRKDGYIEWHFPKLEPNLPSNKYTFKCTLTFSN